MKNKLAILLLAVLACGAWAAEQATVYTVQVSSWQEKSLSKAIEQARELDAKGCERVRVERLGDMYAVRVGVFENKEEASVVFKKLQTAFPTSFVRTAYLIEDRVVYPVKAVLPAECAAAAPEEPATETVQTAAAETGEAPAVETEVKEQPTATAAPAEVKTAEETGASAAETVAAAATETASAPSSEPVAAPETKAESRPVMVPEPEILEAPQGILIPIGMTDKRNRFEVGVSYEYLAPARSYDNWFAFNLAYYRRQSDTFTYFGQLSSHFRGSNGVYFCAGAYKDWAPWLYTYTDVGAGTKTDYLPRYRIDQDFNFKLGSDRTWIWTLGGTYVRYYDIHRDLIYSTGLTKYFPKGVVSYRIFHNMSDPGSVTSYSQTLSGGYGMEKWQWTFLTLSYGKQAYLGGNFLTPEEVNQNSLGVTLSHRHWLGKEKTHGVFGDISYLNLEDGYDKYGFSAGIFNEF